MVQELDLIASRLPRLMNWVIADGTAGLAGGVIGYLLSHACGFMLVRFVGSAGHFEDLFNREKEMLLFYVRVVGNRSCNYITVMEKRMRERKGP